MNIVVINFSVYGGNMLFEDLKVGIILGIVGGVITHSIGGFAIGFLIGLIILGPVLFYNQCRAWTKSSKK
jgi:hypothetical protein